MRVNGSPAGYKEGGDELREFEEELAIIPQSRIIASAPTRLGKRS